MIPIVIVFHGVSGPRSVCLVPEIAATNETPDAAAVVAAIARLAPEQASSADVIVTQGAIASSYERGATSWALKS